MQTFKESELLLKEDTMSLIPIFLGVMIALAIFLYLFSKYNEEEEKTILNKSEIGLPGTEKNIGVPKRPDELRKRYCPLCGTELKPHDSLYAEMYDAKPRPKVIIHGCRYCYIPSRKKNITPSDFDMNSIDNISDVRH